MKKGAMKQGNRKGRPYKRINFRYKRRGDLYGRPAYYVKHLA